MFVIFFVFRFVNVLNWYEDIFFNLFWVVWVVLYNSSFDLCLYKESMESDKGLGCYGSLRE